MVLAGVRRGGAHNKAERNKNQRAMILVLLPRLAAVVRRGRGRAGTSVRAAAARPRY